MIGNVLRTIRGIEVSEETLSLETIREAALGPGHFLGSKQTLHLMKSDYLYPALANRQSTGQWEQDGGVDAFARAHVSAKELLSNHYPSYLDAGVDARIRALFPIVLASEDMRAGNGRW